MSWRALLFRIPNEPSNEPTTLEIAFDGTTYRVRLRRHPKARRYTLRVDSAARDVILTMPTRGSVRAAREFAQKHGGWIATRLSRLPKGAPFAQGVVVPLRGIAHRIAHRPAVRGTVWTETDEAGDLLLCVTGEAPHIDRRIADFLKREARRDLDAASRRHAHSLGVTIKRISVRDQTSRWGSCSSTGVLSYSWRLILAPAFVLDYLAAHEVAHLAELNHSPRFWRLVRSLVPEFERAKTWLGTHGGELHRFGLPAIDDNNP
jgi:predicted metal-dependent hydrolase